MIATWGRWLCGLGGLIVFGGAMAAALELEDLRVEGWRLTVVPLGQTVVIEPPSLKEAACETVLKEGTPGWHGPFLLPGSAWAFRALRVETLEAVLADDPSVRLEAGRDFALDPDWGAVAALPGSAYPPGTKVRLSYRYGLSRIDLVERTPDGRLNVVRGIEDKSQPRLPTGTSGHIPLLSVALPNHARALAPEMLCVLDPTHDGVPPVARAERLAGVSEKLASDAPVTMVFFGDSITVQPAGDFRDGRGNYVDRFAAWLREAYPRRETIVAERTESVEPRPGRVIVVKAGVGGDDTERGLKRLESDVLARRPDLVAVMFGVNDENRAAAGGNVVPPPVFRRNLTRMVKEAGAAGAAVIVITPGMKNPEWSATTGNIAEYAEVARDVAAEQSVCLVDNHRAWELVRKRGYTPMVLLGNCINHPVDLAHEQMFLGLRAALEAAGRRSRGD
jgi:lysophospholipase L1-like esterase